MTWGIVHLSTFLVAVGVGIPAASAQAPIARARLELQATSTCTDPTDLIARVVARSPRIQFVEDSAAIGIQATFAAIHPAKVKAELVLVESSGARTQRRLVTRTCAEAADAVALMIAVALDPVWMNEHRPVVGKVAGESDPGGSSDRSSGVALPVPQATSTLKRSLAEGPSAKKPGQPSRPPQAPLPLPTAADATPTAAPRMQPHASAYLAGQTIWGPSPATMPGVAIYALAALDRDSLWSPAIAIGVIYAWRNNLSEPGGKASFSLEAATLDTCAIRLRSSIVDMRVCAVALIGRISASGSDTESPAAFAKFYAAAGAASVLTLDLGSRVELVARIGTGLTLRRDSYEFGTAEFHTASRFTTSASVGIGMRLW
jgi:hypothetical protein